MSQDYLTVLAVYNDKQHVLEMAKVTTIVDFLMYDYYNLESSDLSDNSEFKEYIIKIIV